VYNFPQSTQKKQKKVALREGMARRRSPTAALFFFAPRGHSNLHCALAEKKKVMANHDRKGIRRL
jgi:hypothetical protein